MSENEAQPFEEKHHPVVSNISIQTPSVLGGRHLTKVIHSALMEAGFTNVEIQREYGIEPSKEAPPSVLDALVARNPSFMASKVSIHSNDYSLKREIPEDSIYPAAGLPVKEYKAGMRYGSGEVVGVDEKGGEHYICTGMSHENAVAIAAAMNATKPVLSTS